MADGRSIHGKNAYGYISGIALVGANAWSLTLGKGVVETKEFGADWARNLSGIKIWSGNFAAWQHQDENLLMDCVNADGPVAMVWYPDSDDATNYFSGSAVYTSYAGSGGVDSAVGGNADFVGDNALAITGFA